MIREPKLKINDFLVLDFQSILFGKNKHIFVKYFVIFSCITMVKITKTYYKLIVLVTETASPFSARIDTWAVPWSSGV